MNEFEISANDDGLRLDKWCKKHLLSLSYGLTQKLLRKGDIKINGKKASAKDTVHQGDIIKVYATLHHNKSTKPRPLTQAQADEIRESVIFEDEQCIAINKPSGLAVQGGTNIKDSVDARLDVLPNESGERAKLVHRLDRDTSGVLLLGKDRKAAARLTEAFRDKETRKIYWALVMGVPDDPIGEINAPLGKRLHENIEKMSVVVDNEEGKDALTHYRVVQAFDHHMCWLELRPITGRTHQLRVHLSAIGHPIVGDGKYGGKSAFPSNVKLDKQLHLHSRSIDIDALDIHVTAPMPEHMLRSWHMLGFSRKDHGVSLLEIT